MLDGHSCISSRKSNVSPSIIGIPVITSSCAHITVISILPSNTDFAIGVFSKFISAKYLKVLPNSLIEEVFPHCLTPQTRRGFRYGSVFQNARSESIFLSMYICTSIKEYTAAFHRCKEIIMVNT